MHVLLNMFRIEHSNSENIFWFNLIWKNEPIFRFSSIYHGLIRSVGFETLNFEELQSMSWQRVQVITEQWVLSTEYSTRPVATYQLKTCIVNSIILRNADAGSPDHWTWTNGADESKADFFSWNELIGPKWIGELIGITIRNALVQSL